MSDTGIRAARKRCSQDLRLLLGHYPTGVCVITAIADDGLPRAMVVGSFTSASLDPPLVGFLPMRSSGTWAEIAPKGKFCVNVLASDQHGLCQKMSGPFHQRFEGVCYHENERGFLLLDNAILHVECGIFSVTPAGDHWFVLGHVLNLQSGPVREPLLFHRGAYCTISSLQGSPISLA